MEENIEVELYQYPSYVAERSKITYKIIHKERIKDDPNISGSNFNVNGDIRATGYMENYTEDRIIKQNDEIEDLKKQLKELNARINMIDDILKILRPFCQELIKDKYFNNMTEEEIAENRKRNSKSIHRTIKNSVNKMNKLYLK